MSSSAASTSEVHAQRLDFSVLGTHAHHLPHRLAQTRRSPAGPCMWDVPDLHGFSAYAVMSSVAARFYQSTNGWCKAQLPRRLRALVRSASTTTKNTNETTHLQYELKHAAQGFPGAEATGAMTRAWWPVRFRCHGHHHSGGPERTQLRPAVPGGHYLQRRQGHAHLGLQLLRAVPVHVIAYLHSELPARRTTTKNPAAASRHATSLI